jgi:quinoprotein dehydrogenase-associated probable ABC transporter substrate-binding protein
MRASGVLAACLALAALLAPPARAQNTPDLTLRTALRVCADPNNMPFSDQKREGFENKIAELVGKDLHLPVEFVWFPQVVGFVRHTLGAQACDVVMGTVSGADMMDTTNPYYHTGYMLVTREADHIPADEVGDPALAGKRFGVVAATPPTNLLLRHKLMGQTTSYALTIDTRYESPARAMLQDLVDHKIDVGLLWGPFAGYYITHDGLKLKAVVLRSETDTPRLDYRIAMGVRPNEPGWRRQLNQVIQRRQRDITDILISYGVPLLDEQDRLIPAERTLAQ